MISLFYREVATNIKRSPLMCIASITTVMVLTMILGYFVVIVLNLNALSTSLISELQVVAYLKDGMSGSAITNLHRQILAVPDVEGTRFVSKEVAFKNFLARLHGSIELDDVSHNPLPNSFEIRVDRPDRIMRVASQVSRLAGVEKVKYGARVAQRMLAFNHLVRLVGIGVLALLFLSTLLVVSNTIRLTVFARRKEIEIMQMVGAAGWFIRSPFILEGVFQGLTGAILAALLVNTTYEMVVPQLAKAVPFLPVLLPAQVLPDLIPGLVLLGVLVGAMGSLLSVNRFLKA